MNFDSPSLLWLSALIVPALLFDLRRYRSRRRALMALFGKSERADPGARGSGRSYDSLSSRYRISSLFFSIFYLCSVVALAGPRWGFRPVPELRSGLDVGIALDVSRSMDVRDVLPSRLERAARILRTLVESSPGIRFSLSLGKGSGVLALPLTDDAEALVSLLDHTTSLSYSSRGTDLEKLIDAASMGFQADFPTNRVIILCSDGESLSGSLVQAVRRAKSQGISIVSLGLGTAEGQGVPVDGDSAELMRRNDGSIVVSSLREDLLREAAAETGGIYISGFDEGAHLRIAEYLTLKLSADGSRGFKREPMPQRHLFLIAALIALGISRAAELDLRRRTGR